MTENEKNEIIFLLGSFEGCQWLQSEIIDLTPYGYIDGGCYIDPPTELIDAVFVALLYAPDDAIKGGASA